MNEKKKTSWDYQKEKNYKKVHLNFNMDDPTDALIYHFATTFYPNRTSFIKRLIYDEMVRCAYEE